MAAQLLRGRSDAGVSGQTTSRPARAILAVLAISLIWRVPSLFDPPWVNDEGTYFAVAQAMAHGYRLYADVWENKPPALYLVYSAVYHLAGSSLLTIRLLVTAITLALVVLVYHVALRETTRTSALVAAMLVGLLMGVPFLEGTTGNAEVFVSALTALAVYLALQRRWSGAAGLVMGFAILFKVVAGFDAAALGIWLVMHRREAVAPYVASSVVVLTSALLIAGSMGILGPMLRDAVLYDLGYVGHGNGAGIPWALLLKLGVLALLTLRLRRAPFPYLWLVYAATGALVSGRFFGHYALQAVVPLALSVAVTLRSRSEISRRLLLALPASCLVLAALSAAAGWLLAASGHDSILARRMQWYVNFARVASGSESYATYSAQIDDHVIRNERLASAVSRLPNGKLLVWGNVPWVYVLSHRLPATPYTSAVRNPPVPGEAGTLNRAIQRQLPAEVVVIHPPIPPMGQIARSLRSHYRLTTQIGAGSIYVSALSADRRPSASTTARVSSGMR